MWLLDYFLNNYTVWRNQKSEEKRLNKFFTFAIVAIFSFSTANALNLNSLVGNAKKAKEGISEAKNSLPANVGGGYTCESLPSNAFPYKPCDKLAGMYFGKVDGKNAQYVLKGLDKLFENGAKSYFSGELVDFGWANMGNLANGRSGYLPVRELADHMFSSNFVLNPTDSLAFELWAQLLAFGEVPALRVYQLYMMDEANNLVLKNGNDIRMAAYSKQEIEKFWEERNNLCTTLAQTKTPWKIVRDYLVRHGNAVADSKSTTLDMIKNKWLFEAVWKAVAEKHKDFAKDNEILLAKHYVEEQNIANLCENLAVEGKAPVKMPPAVKMEDAFNKALMAKAKEAYGDKVVKAYFTTKDWHTFKNPNYPYEVKHRSVNAAIIVKEGEKYFMYTRAFLQNYNGKTFTANYAIQAPMPDPGKTPVIYK